MPLPEHSKNWVMVRWNIFGFYYIGPFQNAEIAGYWAEKNDGCDVNWVIAHLDPTVSLVVRAPGPMPALQPDPEPDPELEEWARQALGYEDLPAWLGDPADYSFQSLDRTPELKRQFLFLMVYSDPLHLIGPFPDHGHAYSWGVDYMARTDDEGWQVVWLDEAGRAPALRQPG